VVVDARDNGLNALNPQNGMIRWPLPLFVEGSRSFTPAWRPTTTDRCDTVEYVVSDQEDTAILDLTDEQLLYPCFG
jgi:hypothetical protein